MNCVIMIYMTIRPTPRMAKAAQLYVENLAAPKPKPLGEVMREAGYSDKVKPANITATDTFQKLLDELIPDDFLIKRHQELIASENEPVSVRAVELGYKVKKKLAGDTEGTRTLNINFGNQPTHAIIDGEFVDISDKHVEVRELSDLDNKNNFAGEEE